MKKGLIYNIFINILIIILFISLSINDALAGAYAYYHSNCNFHKMGKVHAKIRNGLNAVAGPCTKTYCPTDYNPPVYLHCGNSTQKPGYYYWTNGGNKWGYAGANLEIWSNTFVPINIWASDANRGWSVTTGGDYFTPLPTEPPADSDGVSSSWLDSVNVVFDKDKHNVILSNIRAGVRSSGDNYSGVMYIIIYHGYWDQNDSGKFKKSQIISSSYIKVEKGKILTGGIFEIKDLKITDDQYWIDPWLYDSMIVLEAKANNISKTINIPEAISMDDIGIFILTESGYGSFLESLLIVEDTNPIHCEDFENTPLQSNQSSVGNWVMYNDNQGNVAQPSNISIINSTDPSRGRIITARDYSGATFLINHSDYDGNWIENGSTCFCFYLKLIDDGVSSVSEGKNSIFIFNNLNRTQALSTTGTNTNPNIGFYFLLNNTYNENTPWQRICLPINLINQGAPLPSNDLGHWVPYGNSLGGMTESQAWNYVIQNVTDIGFFVDFNPVQGEIIGLDSICVGCWDPPCDEFGDGQLNLECCQYTFEVNNSRGNIKKIEYTLTGGTMIGITTTGCLPTTIPSSLLGTTSGTLLYTPACNVNQTFQVEVLPNTASGGIHIDWVVTHLDGSVCNYTQEYKCLPMPIARCDSIRVQYLPEPDVNMTGRTITIYNEKIPVSPIDRVSIDYVYTGNPPEPLPLNRSGGHLQVDNEIGTTYYRTWYQNLSGNYTYFPQDGLPWECNNPPLHQNPSDSKIKFNLKYDWTAGWVGKLRFTIHHCDGQECYREFQWNGNNPWFNIEDLADLEAETNQQIISLKLKGSPRLPKEIGGINITVLNPDATLIAATTPLLHGAKIPPQLMNLASTLTDMKSATFEFFSPLTLSEGEESQKVEIALLRESGYKTDPKFDITLFDVNGNEFGHDTISVGTPVGIIENSKNPALMDIRLIKCVPTPSSDIMKLNYDVLKADNIIIKMFNDLGEEIMLIENSYKDVGTYEKNISTIGLPSGTYYIKMTSPTQTSTLPVVIRK